MSKYCQKCGTVLEDSATVCPKCGAATEIPAPAAAPAPQAAPIPPQQAPVQQAPVQQAPVQQAPVQPGAQPYAAPVQPAPAEPKKGMNKGLIFGIAGGAAGLVLIIVLIIIFAGMGGAKGTFKKGIAAVKAYDIQKAADLQYELNFDENKTKDEYIKQQEEYRTAYPDEVAKQQEKFKTITYNNLSIRKLDAEETTKMKTRLADEGYKDTGAIKEISQLYYNVVYDNTASQQSCYAIKVGSKWFIYGADFG